MDRKSYGYLTWISGIRPELGYFLVKHLSHPPYMFHHIRIIDAIEKGASCTCGYRSSTAWIFRITSSFKPYCPFIGISPAKTSKDHSMLSTRESIFGLLPEQLPGQYSHHTYESFVSCPEAYPSKFHRFSGGLDETQAVWHPGCHAILFHPVPAGNPLRYSIMRVPETIIGDLPSLWLPM